jgi:uncharacterized protein (DUF2062 family)
MPLMDNRYIRTTRDFLVHRVLHADDTPHRIALGMAIGVFIAWTPTVGFQMALVVALAWLLDANRVVGIPVVWVSNPVTFAPIYLPNYYVGRWIVGSRVPPPDFAGFANATGGWLAMVRAWWTTTWHGLLPLWLGSLVVATVLGVASYFTTHWGVVVYRRKLGKLRGGRLERSDGSCTPPAAPPATEQEKVSV